MLSREGESQEEAFSQVLDLEVWEQDSGLQENLPNQVLRVCSRELPSPGGCSREPPRPRRSRLLPKLVLALEAWVELVLVASGSPQVPWYRARCSPALARQGNPLRYQVLGFPELFRAACSPAQVFASLAWGCCLESPLELESSQKAQELEPLEESLVAMDCPTPMASGPAG